MLDVLPPPELASAVARSDKAAVGRANGVGPKLAQRIVTELTGKPLQPGQLHVTLCHLGGSVPADAAERATERAASLAMPSFTVGFDRAGSFKNGAFVLRGDDSLIGLEVLQQRLSDSLDGSPRPARAFAPHMTLLRDAHRVADHEIEPIEWQVKDIVLMQDLTGRLSHRPIARVPLGPSGESRL